MAIAVTEIRVSTAHAGAQAAGDVITFTLVTDAPVTATGSPRLTLSN